MSLLESIYEWSISQRPCLRDALRRLLDSSALTDADYDDLFALLKLEAGIPDPSNRSPKPLGKEHLPSVTTLGSTVRLLAIQNLRHVNRIAENQKVAFDPAGLTVIYGDNGTGKSGYSRVLKLACRARGEKAVVLPNANLPKHEQGIPEAEIIFELNGTKTKFKWGGNSKEHPELASLSVFDSHCARAYLDAEQDVAYLPYGLDIVENLANVVLPELSKRLKAAIAQCSVDPTQFQELNGATKVGAMIAGLSHKTDISLVETLATFTEKDNARLVTLGTTLSEQNPKMKAAQLKRLVERLRAVQRNIETAFRFVNNAALEGLQMLVSETERAVASERLALEVFHSGEDLLPATGCPEWQTLFDAARRFAALAYRSDDFPITGEGARCPLCQQVLEDGAARLKRFDTFIKDNAAILAKSKRAELANAVKLLEAAKLDFAIDQSLAEEVEHYDAKLCPSLRTLEAALEDRRSWMLKGVKDGRWEGGPQMGHDSRPDLTAFIDAIINEASAHELASKEETRRALEHELAELDARRKCKKSKQLILDAISKMKMAIMLESCFEHVKTAPITNKSKEFAQEAVTQALSDALNSEFALLNVGHIKTKLKTRAKDGKTYHKVILDVPTTCKFTEILSEGELRVMAIASFLAELSLANHSGGAIFDDPVSSLDHFRRSKVARRLADESKNRQVIIFTHDTVFLAELRGIVEREKLSAQFYHLEWTAGNYAGYCNNGLPWHHQSFVDRIDSLEKECRALKQDWLPNPNAQLCDRMRNAYSHFRATIERAVETIFLNGVVQRFENYIPVANIRKVSALTPSEFSELDRLYKLACDVTNAHDPATRANHPPPIPLEFESHIGQLKTLVDAFKARQRATT